MESLFLYCLCKFLVEGNSDKVQQIVHGLSLSIGTCLSNWDWTFETHSDQTILSSKFAAYWCVFYFQRKLSPGDLNTKRLGGELRKFLGRLMGLFRPHDSARNDDNTVRRIRRINRATREQCVRLIQMANATLGMCMKLKGCNSDVFSHQDPVTCGSANNDDGELQMVWWTLVDWLASTSTYYGFGCMTMVYKASFSMMAQFIGFSMMFAAVGFACAGPMVWRNYGWLQQFALRHAAWLMGLRFQALVKPSLWVAWWILKKEIAYLHESYRESGQRGGFMVGVENVYGMAAWMST